MLINPAEKQKLVDALLFVRPFEVTVDMSPEQCRDRLMGLSQPASGFFNRMRIVTEWGKTTDDAYRPRVLVQRYNKGYYTHAQFDATIFRTKGMTRTLVQGKFRIGTSVLVTGVLFTLFFAYVLTQLFPYYPLLVLCFIVGFILIEITQVWEVRRDYRRLQVLINEAFI